MKIKTTDNYSLFKEIDGNRDAKPRQDLEDSLRTYGWLYPIICIKVGLLLHIIDGQHRFKTAQQMGFDIHYIEFHSMTRDEEIALIAMLNNTSKPWTPMNYVEAWAQLDKPAYVEILDLASTYNFTVTSIINIYTVRSPKVRQNMQQGKLILDAKLKGRTVLNHVTLLKQLTPFTNRMLEGFNQFYMGQTNFNITQFYDRLRKNIHLLKDITERKVFADVFTTIYND